MRPASLPGPVGVHDIPEARVPETGTVTRSAWTGNTSESGIEVQDYF
ncbi:MAG: hypothetical protein ACE5GJ_10015 [Gemmatimonadota bacterium]